ncbi:MAG: hypothetical protein ACAI34_16320 [Verrucomicrobium sp.]|nr:hypothetical protein [Verrucomicrobium sp.]
MKIVGIESMTGQELGHELDRGGKFVVFEYTISVLIMTFKRSSDIYFVKGGHSAVAKGLGFSALTFVLGWWGIPWGPIYSIGSLITNFSGGKNITNEVLAALSGPQ